MLIGTDAEAFIRGRSSGIYRASCGKLGGTKGNPVDIGDGFSVQEDNVTVEFNTPPCATPAEFVETVARAKRAVQKYVRTKFTDEPVNLVYADAVLFDRSELRHPGARTFGCTPELDAYSSGRPFTPEDISKGEFRFAGFHLHFGFKGEEEFAIPGFVASALLEALLCRAGSNPLFDEGSAGTALRHLYYGKPGAYRDTKYPGGYVGIEYRRLGSGGLNSLGVIQQELSRIWEHFEVLCRDRKAAAELYNTLDLASLMSRKLCYKNAELVDSSKRALLGE